MHLVQWLRSMSCLSALNAANNSQHEYQYILHTANRMQVVAQPGRPCGAPAKYFACSFRVHGIHQISDAPACVTPWPSLQVRSPSLHPLRQPRQLRADLLDEQIMLKTGVQLKVSANRLAARALMYASALSIGCTSAGILATGYFMGVRNVSALGILRHAFCCFCELRRGSGSG